MNNSNKSLETWIKKGYQPKALTTHGEKTPVPDSARLNLQKLRPPKMESAVQPPKDLPTEKK